MLLFRCRKCGTQAADLEGHKCVAAASVAPTRLEVARAALASVGAPVVKEDVLATLGPPVLMQDRHLEAIEAAQAPKEKRAFDRNAYHKAYMKAYMRDWRARKKGGG